MNIFQKLRFIIRVSGSMGVIRRYFVVNSFDGALTLLGLNTGFYLSAEVELSVVIHACTGTAIALCMSGISSAYLSETAERQHELAELQRAMVNDLDSSIQRTATRVIPVCIAMVNGLSPFFFALLIIAPLWLAQAGLTLVYSPIVMAIGVAFIEIFFLGMFLAKIGAGNLIWSGIKALSIAVTTVLLILLLEG
ncbi:MAG: putative membrane protein (TIGR00267 family) [Motiliproteus sp.]|jgi:predicted membrane protein (TIGR00267 family)